MPRVFLPAAILSLMLCTTAYAAPHAVGSQATAPSDIVQAKKEGKGDYKRDWGNDDWRDRQAYRHDRYSNWHRYSYRPDDWDDRGCVTIGPLWYCP